MHCVGVCRMQGSLQVCDDETLNLINPIPSTLA